MCAYIVEGGRALQGCVQVHGAKNSVLPILAACLLAPGACVIQNCPRLSDVEASLAILRHLGCRAEREGDAVVLYERNKDADNVTNKMVFKGNIESFTGNTVRLRLRASQQNAGVLPAGSRYAIEHDSSDTSTTNALRGLYTFLLALPDRKDLLLGNREPQQDFSQKLNGSYGDFNDLVLKEKQATDYFLLVGPPGTGKTSCALHYMVKEALTDPKASILLLSYTNRAVDEICNMLIDSGITEYETFIRIGNF